MGILQNTGLTDVAHCYVNGIVNVRDTKPPNFHKTFPHNRLHSLACFVYCWYNESNMQKGQEDSEPTDKLVRFNLVVLSIRIKHQVCAKQSIWLVVFIITTEKHNMLCEQLDKTLWLNLGNMFRL
jgi:hypothetical protein